MRGQDSSRRLRRPDWMVVAAGVLLFVATTAIAQVIATTAPQLVGRTPSMETGLAAPLPKWIVDDQRRMRAYPDQPPIIPHSIEGYELSVNDNRCMSCHHCRAYAAIMSGVQGGS